MWRQGLPLSRHDGARCRSLHNDGLTGAPVLVRQHLPGETVENRTGEKEAMREAKLVGLSQDGKSLILAEAETGEEFAVPVDDRLRAALRGDRARLGQLEIQMESALRPRDIQARIRAGESPEAVAAVAQVPMERLMAFAGPVMAEREHIASLAQRASVAYGTSVPPVHRERMRFLSSARPSPYAETAPAGPLPAAPAGR